MSAVHRASAGLKLGVAAALIFGLAALPAERAWWGLCALPPLLALALLARIPIEALLSRWALGAPFLLAAASLGYFQPHGLRVGLALLAKSAVCLLTLQLLIATTPVTELTRTLCRLHLPLVLCETIALLARYSDLLSDEARRMRRARTGRTLRGSRFQEWLALGNSLGLLFVRTVSRAERVQSAMRSRGGA
ncbi:MAG TPA: CbiQ family ECF transporter T component [Polyangiaceae bacterium]|nr:CbiQ family ECF transporter T component [Polyangiaceae bacterium]